MAKAPAGKKQLGADSFQAAVKIPLAFNPGKHGFVVFISYFPEPFVLQPL